MAETLRQELGASYRTTLKRTLVKALQSVFTQDYPEPEFQNLNVTLEYPLTELEYPCIIVKYNEGGVYNAGVGHVEYFADPNNVVREWRHRRYEGSIEFTIAALSPLSRDVLADAVIEILSFNTLDPLLHQFFYSIYGAPGDPYQLVNLLHQISLNTDEITSTGENVSVAPWQPEDALVYQTGYTSEVSGGFYNAIPNTRGAVPVGEVDFEVYLLDQNQQSVNTTDASTLPFGVGTKWVFPTLYQDEDIATLSPTASADEVFTP